MLLVLAGFGNEGRRPGLLVSRLKCFRVSKFFARYDALAARKWQGSRVHLGRRIPDLCHVCWSCSNVVHSLSYTRHASLTSGSWTSLSLSSSQNTCLAV